MQPKALEQIKGIEFKKLRKFESFSWNNKQRIIREKVNQLMGAEKQIFFNTYQRKAAFFQHFRVQNFLLLFSAYTQKKQLLMIQLQDHLEIIMTEDPQQESLHWQMRRAQKGPVIEINLEWWNNWEQNILKMQHSAQKWEVNKIEHKNALSHVSHLLKL